MTMLPVPGSDLNIWGTKLNTLLTVSIDGNTGRILSSAITGAGGYVIPSGGIPATDMAIGVQSNLNLASTAIQNVNGHSGPTVTLKASDVAGGAVGTSGQVLTTDGSGNGSWSTVTSGVSSVNGRSGAVTLAARDVASGAAGTIGQLLASDGAGNGSWANPPSPNPHAVFLFPLGGGADDTPQINTAIANAVSAAQTRGDNYAEIWFMGVFQIKGALIQGGASKSNAQIVFPMIAPTAQKVVVALRGPKGGDTLPFWNQTVGQKAGAVLYTTLTGQTNSGTFGPPSVVGSPTREQLYGDASLGAFPTYPQYNNMHVIVDGISVVNSAVNPTMCGFDFWGMANMTIGTAGAFVDAATLGTGAVGATVPTHNWVFGLRTPSAGNNDVSNITSWSCEGYYYGISIGEHCVIVALRVIYNFIGVFVNTLYYGHSNEIMYCSAEANTYHVYLNSYQMIDIYCLDTEPSSAVPPWTGGADIYDTGASGHIGFTEQGSGTGEGQGPTVVYAGTQAATAMKIINISRKKATFGVTDGLVAVPGSNAAPLLNPYWRDAFASIVVTGGLISNVQITSGVGQRSTGQTTTGTSGQILVPIPSGCSIQLTYTGTITWVWTII